MLNDSNMNFSPFVVYVDADACPVKDEIVDLCILYSIDMVFVASYAHDLFLQAPARTVTVDPDKEAVDLYLVNYAKKGDVCITQDHGLASLLLSKGITVLSPRGENSRRNRSTKCWMHVFILKSNGEWEIKRKARNLLNRRIVNFLNQVSKKFLKIKQE